jgi:hypothetical protein
MISDHILLNERERELAQEPAIYFILYLCFQNAAFFSGDLALGTALFVVHSPEYYSYIFVLFTHIFRLVFACLLVVVSFDLSAHKFFYIYFRGKLNNFEIPFSL